MPPPLSYKEAINGQDGEAWATEIKNEQESYVVVSMHADSNKLKVCTTTD